MPKSLTIGFNYYQEHAPEDDALDRGDDHRDPAVIDEWRPEPIPTSCRCSKPPSSTRSARGFKYYAPGVGLIKEEEGLKPNYKNPTADI